MSRIFTGKSLDMVSFPMGGLGAGSICLNGNGRLGSFSIWNKPNVKEIFNCYSAITICGENSVSRVLETKLPEWSYMHDDGESFNGLWRRNYGLPRFEKGEFSSRFPFATVKLSESELPIIAEISGWSPFIPGDEDSSGMPFAALEYTIQNISNSELSLVYYFNCENFIDSKTPGAVKKVKNGFAFYKNGTEKNLSPEAAFCVSSSEDAYIDTAWFRGDFFDTQTMVWNNLAKGEYRNAAYDDIDKSGILGGTIAIPFRLAAGESKTVKIRICWYMPNSDIRTGADDAELDESRKDTYKPWYTTVIDNIEHANQIWNERYDELYEKTRQFTETFYSSTLPEVLHEAAAANLSILKSPTILRQTDGRLWGWEGCRDYEGVCDGSCTHVWNYAQAICHLFPRLERSLRQSEFYEAQSDETGHQEFRIYLPIRKAQHNFHAASDGQLGGIMKIYRDWRISGDIKWLTSIWPRVKQSMEFCIKQWDSSRRGIIDLPHHNTYDIEFYGSDGMSMSFYLGALKAFCKLKEAMGEDFDEYLKLFENGKKYLEEELYDGEYFYQKHIATPEDYKHYKNPEELALCSKEGPKYQYGTGCLSDGIIGVWLAELFGLSDIVDNEKVDSMLLSIYKYNFRKSLHGHTNAQRPGYATVDEGGLLLCSWPKGGKPSLPFIYSDEIWCGIEYQVASHLISRGRLEEGLNIVNTCRSRYNGVIRNPYNEYECGYWYARSMASYSLLQAYTGVRYDAVEKTLYYRRNNSDCYTTFLATESGYGLVEVNGKDVTLKVVSGEIPILKIVETDCYNHNIS